VNLLTQRLKESARTQLKGEDFVVFGKKEKPSKIFVQRVIIRGITLSYLL